MAIRLSTARPVASAAALLLAWAGLSGAAAAQGDSLAEAAVTSAPPSLIYRQGAANSAWRLESAAGLAPGHELRLTSSPGLGVNASLLGESVWRLDPRATYRYTFLEQQDWALKVGITTAWRDSGADGLRLGGVSPLLHFAGERKLGERWRLNLDADSAMSVRLRSLDLGLRVNYLLNPNLAVYGGYRLSDGADTEEYYLTGSSAGLNNSANIGVRYRF